jgi:hypothetical protein
MKKLLVVGQILDSCLTTETLNWLSLPEDKWKNHTEKKTKLFIELLEYAGNVVTEKLKRDLEPDEVILAYNRVRQFLIARGLD